MPKIKRRNRRRRNNKKSKEEYEEKKADDAVEEMHTTEQRIDAVHSNTPYIKERLAIPDDKSQVFDAIQNYTEWDKFYMNKKLPSPSDWLHEHPKEKRGQTFNSWYRFIKKSPVGAFLRNSNKDSIGLVTCGSFNLYLTDKLYPLFDILSQFTQTYFFGINIEILNPISVDDIVWRYNSYSKNKQLKTGSIESELKKLKKKQNNLCCLMGISIIDLYPDDSWNFVFGEASIHQSVGIFSFARYLEKQDYDPMKELNKLENLRKMINGEISNDDKNWLNKVLDEKEQMIFIRRCLGVLLHEIGHLFGLEHCPYFECLMNGSNHMEESDAAPLHLCPVCLHKLYFASKIMQKAERNKKRGKRKKNDKDETNYLDILTRYQRLSILYEKYGLIDESIWCKKRASFVFDSCTLNQKETTNNMDNDTEMKDD